MKIVLGIDGGLAHLGWAVAEVGGAPRFLDAGVIETVRRADETSADSHTIRALELHRALREVFEKYKPDEVCAEAFSPPRDARNAAMLAWSWGVICALAGERNIPIRAKSPMPLKASLTGNRTAKKPEMISAVLEQYPETEPLFPKRSDLHEHLADACAAIHYFHGAAA